jgi:glutathionylspermidine synthase
MRRLPVKPRSNWQAIVEEQGFEYHTRDHSAYWDESVAYELTATDAGQIVKATETLYQLCLQAVQRVIDEELYAEMKIPAAAIPLIRDSWIRETPSVYGRFDLAYDGTGEPKMLEFNAQTPTSLLESGAIQERWRQQVFPKARQVNDNGESA